MTSINPNVVFAKAKDPYCDHLASPSPGSFGLSIFLVAAILGSYLPQHSKIVRLRTSAGLSPWWVLLGTVSSTFAIANILVLPSSQHDLACCRQISGVACAAALLGVVQIGVQWTCFTIIMILFLVFFPRQALDNPDESHDPDVPKMRDAIIVGVTSLVALLTVGIISTAFLVSAPSHLLSWANLLGISASIVSSIQYLPQLWTTWRLKHIFSLSILTMCIQVPGAFLFAFSLWLRVGWQGWSTWMVYCVTGVLQGGLLAMAIYFSYQDKEHAGDDGAGSGPTEEDPLLGATNPNGRVDGRS